MRAITPSPKSFVKMVTDLPPDSPAKPKAIVMDNNVGSVLYHKGSAIVGVDLATYDAALAAESPAKIYEDEDEDEDEEEEEEEEEDPAACCGGCAEEFGMGCDKCPVVQIECDNCCGCYVCEGCGVHLGPGADDVPGACADCFYCPGCKDCDCDPVPGPMPPVYTFKMWKLGNYGSKFIGSKNVCEGCNTYVPSITSGKALAQGFCYECYKCEVCEHASWCPKTEYAHFKQLVPTYPTNGRNEWGSYLKPLWEQRGVELVKFEVDDHDYLEAWDLHEAEGTDICTEMASFYLAEGMESMAFNRPPETTWLLGEVAREARDYRRRQVARLDPLFQRYCDMAIGGELRHHRSCRMASSFLYGERPTAWIRWKALRDGEGPELLKDAAAMFRDIEKDGYGGELWAVGCDLLYQRQMRQIPPALWVDRVFTLQHNGGSFLNKIEWATTNRMYWHLKMATTAVGPAHAHTDTKFPVLLAVADEHIVSLFGEYWKEANRIKGRWRQATEPLPTLGQGWYRSAGGQWGFGWKEMGGSFPTPIEMYPEQIFGDGPRRPRTARRVSLTADSFAVPKLLMPMAYLPKEGTPPEVVHLVPPQYMKVAGPEVPWLVVDNLDVTVAGDGSVTIIPKVAPPPPGTYAGSTSPELAKLMQIDPSEMSEEKITSFGELTKYLYQGTHDGANLEDWDGASKYPMVPSCPCGTCILMVKKKQAWLKKTFPNSPLNGGKPHGTM